MTIETKHDKGDTLWTMWEHRICFLVVMSIQINIQESVSIMYGFEVEGVSVFRLGHEVFPTKEALIASL